MSRAGNKNTGKASVTAKKIAKQSSAKSKLKSKAKPAVGTRSGTKKSTLKKTTAKKSIKAKAVKAKSKPASKAKTKASSKKKVSIIKANPKAELTVKGTAKRKVKAKVKAATKLKAKGVNQDPTILPAAEALRMLTINAAQALNWQDEIGSLEVGKQADMISIDLATINSQPIYDPMAQVIYACQSQQVANVWVAGQHLLRNGEHTTLDITKLIEQGQRFSQQTSKDLIDKEHLQP